MVWQCRSASTAPLASSTSSRASSNMSSFHLFPLLPAELRIQIWGMAVSSLPARQLRVDRKAKKRGVMYLHSRAIPTLLLVCWESHTIAAQRYCRAFASKAAGPGSWLDFATDIVKFNMPDHSFLPNHPDKQRLTRIKVYYDSPFAFPGVLNAISIGPFTSMRYLEFEASLRSTSSWIMAVPEMSDAQDGLEVVVVAEGCGRACTTVQLVKILEDWYRHLNRTNFHRRCSLETFMKRSMPLHEDGAA